MKTSTLIGLLLLTLLGVNGAVQAASYTGVGKAVVIAGDYTGAEELALRAARKDAASQAMDRFQLDSGVDAQQYAVNKTRLLSGDLPFLEGEKVLGKQEDRGLLTLHLRVEVSIEELARFFSTRGLQSATAMQDRKSSLPAVMVLMVEEMNGGINPTPYSTPLLQQALADRDFTVVDQAAVERVIKHDQAVQAVINQQLASAQAAALQFNAGILVTGRAMAQASGVQSGIMQAYGATVNLQAVEADSGRVLANASAEGSYPHVNAMQGARKAIEEATLRASNELLGALEQQALSSRSTLLVNISGVNFQQLSILKEILARDFPSVMSMENLGFAGDLGRLRVRLDGSTTDFAEQVARKDFGAFRLRVLSASSAKLDLALDIKGAN